MKKYRIIIALVLISTLLQLILNDFIIEQSIGSVVVQFLASFILGYVYTRFHLKYSKISFIKVWGIFYAIIVGASLTINLLGLMP